MPIPSARPWSLARTVPAWLALTLLVIASAAARFLLALPHDKPLYLPDEYIYAELARSISETGLPLVRGELANFPGLFQPILTAPLWLAGDTELALRGTQALHAVVMSLAALPVYLLATGLGLGTRTALWAAGAAVAAPGVVYSAYVLSDPVGYTLALAALWAGVRSLDRPSPGREATFLALGGLATLTRVQYGLLVGAYVVAAVALERGRPRQLLRRFPLTACAALIGAAVLVLLGPARLLGPYWLGTRGGVDVQTFVSWIPVEGMLFAYGAGWAIASGAVVGLACAAGRPRSRAEAAFGALAVGLAVGLFAVAAVVAAVDVQRFQERYLIALVPVAAIAFALGWTRGAWARYAAAAGALALFVVAIRVPVSTYSIVSAVTDSPTLWGVRQLSLALGSAADAALIVAIAATGLSLVVVASALRRSSSGIGVVAVSTAALVVLSLGAHWRMAELAAATPEPAPRDWIDRAGFRSVALLQPRISSRQLALSHLVWNRSIDQVLLLGGGKEPDPFGNTRVVAGSDGRLLAAGRAVRGAFLVDGNGATVAFQDAELVAAVPGYQLWRSEGTPRLSLLALGRYVDGWLGGGATITIWPDESGRTRGTLRLTVGLPRGRPITRLRFSMGADELRVALKPGDRRSLAIPVETLGPAVVGFSADRYLFDGRRSISVRASRPVFERVKTRPLPADIP